MAYGGAEIPPMPDFLADLMDKSDPAMGSSAKEKSERDTRWIGDFADDLTVAIALRKWPQATALVEEGQLTVPIIPHNMLTSHRRTQTLGHALTRKQTSPSQISTHNRSSPITFYHNQPEIHRRPAYISVTPTGCWCSSTTYILDSAIRCATQGDPGYHI